MIGGGIEEDEDPLEGAQREIKEETGLEVSQTDLMSLAKVICHITIQPPNSKESEQVEFTAFIYGYHLPAEKTLQANDDVDGFIHLSEAEVKQLINRLRHLPPTIHENVKFAWSDYGNLFAEVHHIALTQLKKHRALR